MLKQSLKNIYRHLFNRPKLGKLGTKSILLRPYTIRGKTHIKIGDHTVIREDSRISAHLEYEGQKFSPTIQIGHHVYIGQNLNIHAINEVIIEDDCVLSDYVYISDSFHGMDPKLGHIMKQPLHSRGGVHIGKSTFIGLGCAILPSVTLGKHCIVGTHSVVTKSFPDYSMIAGNPAKLIKVYDVSKNAWIPAPKDKKD